MYHVFYYCSIDQEWQLLDSYETEKDAHTISYALHVKGILSEVDFFHFKAIA